MFFKDLEIQQRFTIPNCGDPEETKVSIYTKVLENRAVDSTGKSIHMFSETPIGLLTPNEERD